MSFRSLKKGNVVKIGRKGWSTEMTRTGVLLKRTYLAYDPCDSKWLVLVDGKTKEFQGRNLFLLR